MASPDLCHNDGNGQSVPLRTCSKCRSALPASTENFSPIKSRNSLHSWCKPCCAENRKKKRSADPTHHRAVLKRSREKHLEASKARNRARWPEYAERNAAVLVEKRLARKDIYNENRRKKYAADLRQHLERQFVKGMTWENYGDWHVDHILPVASFSYDTVDCPDFHACWAMANLRPMWAVDNIRKRDRRTLLI